MWDGIVGGLLLIHLEGIELHISCKFEGKEKYNRKRAGKKKSRGWVVCLRQRSMMLIIDTIRMLVFRFSLISEFHVTTVHAGNDFKISTLESTLHDLMINSDFQQISMYFRFFHLTRLTIYIPVTSTLKMVQKCYPWSTRWSHVPLYFR